MHKEGWSTIITVLSLLALLTVILFLFNLPCWVIALLLLPEIIYTAVIINFFRYPNRTYAGDYEHDVVAPSDGTIVTIEELQEPDYFGDKRIQVSIFMSVSNVHAQWCPCNGQVLKCEHENGNFKKAYLPKSSSENERSTIVVKSDAGPTIMMRQVAGAVARRIVTYISAGDRSEINGELGFIKFGSRIDLFLPVDAKLCVKIGDKVKGNISTIAKL